MCICYIYQGKEEVTAEEGAPAPSEEAAPAEEVAVEPSAAAENKSAPAADEGETVFPGGGGVEQVDQTCCGGFATKSKICVIQ